ncbi:hypothetical protein TNCV_4012991 [Trichonephila clavipes]|nr:hypothetical protein TNCV_4012991 [Trichonephila clavipes]
MSLDIIVSRNYTMLLNYGKLQDLKHYRDLSSHSSSDRTLVEKIEGKKWMWEKPIWDLREVYGSCFKEAISSTALQKLAEVP